MRRKKCRSSVLLARRPPALHRRILRELREEEEAGGVERQTGALGGGEGAEREDTNWAEGDKKFEDWMGRESCISRGGPD